MGDVLEYVHAKHEAVIHYTTTKGFKILYTACGYIDKGHPGIQAL